MRELPGPDAPQFRRCPLAVPWVWGAGGSEHLKTCGWSQTGSPRGATGSVELPVALQALATTSRTSTLSTVTPSGTTDLTISLAVLAASSDSQTDIDSPPLAFLVQ